MWLRFISLLLLVGGAPCVLLAAADQFRGGEVEWARLATQGKYWDRHAAADHRVLDLMREHSSLNIQAVWRSANVSRLEELCAYPFIFADTIAPLTDPELGNLSEYLRRGGFLLIDACRNRKVNPRMDWFLAAQIAQFKKQFPDLRVVTLEPSHEIFSIYFKMREFPPWRKMDTPEPLRALYVNNRMVGVISLVGFQCGWEGYGGAGNNAVDCLQMVTNVYFYAMTR